MGSTIDISPASRELLSELALKTGQSQSEVIDKALDVYRRQVFFDKLNAGYAALKADPQAWAEFQAEQKEWDDAPINDTLANDERWTDDGNCSTNQ
jgi:hypothetical protein